MLKKIKTLFGALLCLAYTSAYSAPTNDDCAGAISLTVNTTCSYVLGNVSGATASPVTVCTGTASDDVWYKFVATGTTATIKVSGSSSFDAVIQLFTACGGTSLYCTDNTLTGEVESLGATGLTAGNTYFIRVYDYFSSFPSTTTFNICVSTPVAPANDNCANAVTLTHGTTCSSTTGNVEGATQSVASTCAGTANDDVWYKFVATAINAKIVVDASTGFNPVLEVFGSCGGSSLFCINNASNGGDETIQATGLTIGSTYFIRVYDYSSSIAATTDFGICVYTPTAPANNECAGAITLPVVSSKLTTTTGTTESATQSLTGCGGTPDDDVWFKFVANNTKDSIYVIGASAFDPVVQVISGGCAGTQLYCTDNTADGGIENIYTTGLTVGQTYYIRVYDFGSGYIAVPTFQISVYKNGSVTDIESASITAGNLTLYPNPVKSEMHVDLSRYNSEVKLEVFDSKGGLVLQQNVEASADAVINTNSLENGIYMVKIFAENAISTAKIVVIK